jgi:catechol 2,3-dioxygenase-like lactoylglutathione lyase family enzyme
MTEPVIVDAYPMFPCSDVSKSAAFYEFQLGFAIVFRQGDEYARLQRDGVSLDLWRCTSEAMRGNEPGCWLMVKNIDALHAEFSATIPNTGIEAPRPTLTPIESKPWGIREFAVLDPDNNVLHVGEREPKR